MNIILYDNPPGLSTRGLFRVNIQWALWMW